MAKRYWNGKQWRRISDAEARLRRQLGQDVVEGDGDPPDRAPPPTPPVRQPAAPPALVTPPAPKPITPPKPAEPAPLPLPPAPKAPAVHARPSVKGPSSVLEFKNSKNLRAAELGADGVLLVMFADGKHYAYANFTPELMAEWEAAQSAGSWFHHNVKSKPDRHPVIEAPKG